MWREFIINVTLITCVLSLSLGNPFLLQNAPAALTNLATSASASASNPSEPITHIADLRKKQQKSEQLQSQKLLTEADDTDIDLSIEGANESENEAAPTLLQKKIGKILKKLRFISRLTGASSGGGGDVNVNVEPTDEGLGSSNATNTTSTENNDTTNTIPVDIDNDVKTSEESTTVKPQTFQKIIYPHSKYDTPLKLSFNINERIVNRPEPEDGKEQSQNIQTVEETGRLGQIGVFFAEIVGSIVGLIYGAAAHIASGTNGAGHLE